MDPTGVAGYLIAVLSAVAAITAGVALLRAQREAPLALRHLEWVWTSVPIGLLILLLVATYLSASWR
jgi:hypothetical protein